MQLSNDDPFIFEYSLAYRKFSEIDKTKTSNLEIATCKLTKLQQRKATSYGSRMTVPEYQHNRTIIHETFQQNF